MINEGDGNVWGGGVGNFATLEAMNCLFIDNYAHSNIKIAYGGGLYDGGLEAYITNCTFFRNHAQYAGGLYGDYIGPFVNNCILWGNTTDWGGSSLETKQISGVSSIDYSCVEGWTGDLGGVGNIGDDPLFVDPDAGDCRLLSGSPCIDAADNTALPVDVLTDLDGNPRYVDDPTTVDTGFGDPPIIDMGAFEYQIEDPCPADINDDGVVNVLDLLAVLSAWGMTGNLPEDITGDGIVDVLDLLEVLSAWGPCP